MDLKLMDMVINQPKGLNAKDREGTFAHTYFCQVCGLHFIVYSWKKDRTKDRCPECNYPFMYHLVKKIEGEIFEYCHGTVDDELSSESIPRHSLRQFILDDIEKEKKKQAEAKIKVTCPKCGEAQFGEDGISMKSTITCSVAYNERDDEFAVDEPDPSEVEEVECECLKCGHEWEWDAYRRNVKEGAE